MIVVNDKFQSQYAYMLEAPIGALEEGFFPELTPKEILALGVFEGKYISDCQEEFPDDWFVDAKLSENPDPHVNAFGIKSRQSLAIWQERGWIIDPDPRGWFQWYCRYYSGRRLPLIDQKQIKRWRAFARHKAQIHKNCGAMDLGCRPRQRQALLQWAYDPFF